MNAVKLFQVTEDDLAELERILPQLGEALTPILTGRMRVHLRRCQTILLSIRWGYGPPTDIRRIADDGEDGYSL
jgi:hypothetical protein